MKVNRGDVDEGRAATKDRLFQGGDQAAAVFVVANVGQPLPGWLADFFFVNSGGKTAMLELAKRASET